MATTKKDYQIIQKLGEDEFLLLHPETNAENVVVDVDDPPSRQLVVRPKKASNRSAPT